MKLGELFSIRRSFRSKLLVALLGCVGLVVGVTYLVVRGETRSQVRLAATRAAEQARRASTELEELRRLELARLGRIFTASPRTLALLESVLEGGGPEFRDVLVQDLQYELQRQRLDASLAAFTDPRAEHVFTLLDGSRIDDEDPGAVEPLADQLLEEGGSDLVAYRLVGERLFMVRVIPLVRSGVVLGTVTLGLPVDDEAPERIGEIVGAEVCFVLDGRCVVGTGTARDTLSDVMVEAAGISEPRRVRRAGREWNLVSEPLSPDWETGGSRVVAVPLAGVVAPFDRISRALRITGVLGLLAALVAALVLSRGLARPVRKLVAATSRIGAGDYDARVEIEARDEMGRLGRAFNEMAEDLALKERYRGVLDKVVSREVADELLKGDLVLGGENRRVTILFADVSGFTSLTEGMEPQRVIGLLNECMERLSAAVEAEGGIVDKYVGDEVMAVFGAPVALGDDALAAVRAALRMQEAMAELSREREERGEAPLEVSVGINTGPVVAGNMGSAERLNYTVLGESVNLASRACQAAAGGEILVSGRTLERTGERLRVRSAGTRELKGFSRPVELFRVEGLAGEGSGEGGSRPGGAGASGAATTLLVAAALAVGATGVPAQEPGGLPTLRDLGLGWISDDGTTQLLFSGRLDVEGYAPAEAEPWIIPETDPFLAGRLRVFADLFVGRSFYGLVELRADRGEEPAAGSLDARIDQAFVRVRPLEGRSLGLQVGKFASPVGTYPRRHHTEGDAFIRPPVAYDRRTVISPRVAPPSTAGFLTWKDEPGRFRPRGSPPIWGAPYQWGAVILGALGPMSVEGGVVNSAPSSGPGRWELEETFDDPPSLVARATVPLSAELRLTGFYDRGPYLHDEIEGSLPDGAEPGDYLQELGGLELAWARGRTTVRGELVADRWEVPNVGEDVWDVSWSLEGRIRPAAGLFLAARWGGIRFNELGDDGPGYDPEAGTPAPGPWDDDFDRIQLAGGYRLAPNVEARAEYALNRTAGPLDPDDDLFSVQLWWAF